MAIREHKNIEDPENALTGEFWRGRSFEELARLQGVRPVKRLEDVLGGWPADEVGDAFEAALARWRRAGERDGR